MRISRSLFPLLAAGIIGLALAGCGPSQSQLDAQSTQAALEIYTTQTQAAEYQHATQTAATPSPTATETPTPTPTPTLTPTPTTPGLYHSQQYPFTIEYPANWVRLPGQQNVSATFGNLAGDYGLYIAEEDLLEIGWGEGTLEEYANLIESYLESLEGFELLSSQQIMNANGFPVIILDFRMMLGEGVRGRRLIYVYQKRIGFNATCLVLEAQFPDLESEISASFDSFKLTE